MTPQTQQPFTGLEPPGPPADLHAYVMRATAEALARKPAVCLWTTIWESRAARLAWAASLACLLLAHITLSFRPHADPPAPGFSLARQVLSMDDELVAIGDLPALRLDAQSRGDADAAFETTDQKSENESDDKEMS